MEVTILPTEIQTLRAIQLRGYLQRHALHLTSHKNPNHKHLILNDRLTNILTLYKSNDIKIFICKENFKKIILNLLV
jgi:hypothetical protein